MDRLSRRIDQLRKAETFSYDGNGNLVSTTDRKNQTSTFTYDPLNRRVRAEYADGAVATFQYDAGGRLVQADDTADPHRPIVMAYDALDRLLVETTALGTVGYQYDALGRRTQMTVGGESPVTYTYDAASRLRTITQAPLNPVDIQYDPLGRRTLLTLPNGVSTEYVYDPGSRLTALIYRNTLGPLGDLSYQYDPAGNRVGVGGSFARTLLPDPAPSATYDAASRQLAFGDKSMTFDDNGSVVTFAEPGGSTAFVWDSRNRLTGLTGSGLTAAFAYDSLSRRATKEVNGERWTYLYDGADQLQVREGAREVGYLGDLRVDEPYLRSDGKAFLADGVGSILAILDAVGNPITQYTYGPFGASQPEGLPDSNAIRFTGREEDGTGLLFYRTRYYHPGLTRFLSEDPLVLDPNVSLYAYVRNAPLRFVDPFGLDPMSAQGKTHYGPWQHFGEPGWYRVYATREGQVGKTTATGHTITDTDVFVALPSTTALNRTVEVEYNNKKIIAPVWDVGPWSRDDPYWEGNGVPRSVLGERTREYQDRWGPPRNPAGIDLSNQAVRDLGMKDNDWVWWRWHDNPTQSFPSGGRIDRMGGRK